MSPVPDVSVVLSVRNGGADLPKAVATILEQTFANFELIAIDNGSVDQTAQFLDDITDPRLRVYHQADAGLASALNRGISLARGRYVARQDHDDWADRTRLEKQVRFLDRHPEHGLVGTRAEIWIGDHPTGRFHDHPSENGVLRFELLFNNPFVHSSVMMRRTALDQVGVYTTDPARQPPEDYELWSRIARRFRVANLPERLTIYREVPTSMSRAGAHPFRARVIRISAENLAIATGRSAPEQVHVDVATLMQGVPEELSQAADIGQMCEVVTEAASKVFEGQFAREDAELVEMRLELLRRRFRFRSPAYRVARAAARRVWGGMRRLRLFN
ncbi:glycosyltransferase family 2 protein [Bradyrhizobium prioriisuperbiae]|uniref:glycosyltransferase family 2 protein n=1 Tax=Bradyrhizobium prioriisuperbiae TaxID=2854389 RepID=UPI0028ED2532|nr:glycosyltransferase family 2 protein [Bradyrhizobium prioritasuperba]